MARLTELLRGRDIDIENMRRQIKEQEISIVQRFEMDTSRKISLVESNMNNLNRENQELKRKYTEMENKAALLSQ